MGHFISLVVLVLLAIACALLAGGSAFAAAAYALAAIGVLLAEVRLELGRETAAQATYSPPAYVCLTADDVKERLAAQMGIA